MHAHSHTYTHTFAQKLGKPLNFPADWPKYRPITTKHAPTANAASSDSSSESSDGSSSGSNGSNGSKGSNGRNGSNGSKGRNGSRSASLVDYSESDSDNELPSARPQAERAKSKGPPGKPPADSDAVATQPRKKRNFEGRLPSI